MYREEEKLCLKWSDFHENAISAFGTLRVNNEFADVTLACEDGQQLEAHKVILAASSPFFLNLLRKNKHPHPLIYMRALKSEDLVAMIDFLYCGEANVSQESLESFLSVAEELQLKGFMGLVAEGEAEETNKSTFQRKTSKPVQKRIYTKQESLTPDLSDSIDNVEPSPPLEGPEAVTDDTVSADLQDLDDKIKSMMMFSENKIKDGRTRARICKLCGKEGPRHHIKSHIEANHITGVSHTCSMCETITRSRHAMVMHKRRNHTEN